jgi:2-amino-4-hydroxy-6-hydroxymethyldihydropteridine diphosphokinase
MSGGLSQVAIGVGASGSAANTFLVRAITALMHQGSLDVLGISDGYLNPSAGTARVERYANAVVLSRTHAAPQALLRTLWSIERALGRVRSVRNAPRSVDLDLLWWQGIDCQSEGLTLPHPRLEARAFALIPLVQAFSRAGRPVPLPLLAAARRVQPSARLLAFPLPVVRSVPPATPAAGAPIRRPCGRDF